jgi:hypothetical protein
MPRIEVLDQLRHEDGSNVADIELRFAKRDNLPEAVIWKPVETSRSSQAEEQSIDGQMHVALGITDWSGRSSKLRNIQTLLL